MRSRNLAAALLLPLAWACSERNPDPVSNAEDTVVAAVLTTDVGAEIDDQWAMVHLLLSPKIDLRAIVTTHASSIGLSSATSEEKAHEVLARVFAEPGSTQPPVRAGSDLPLTDVASPRYNAGVELLLRLSQDFSSSQRLVVFVMGAATDVASAILQDPSLIERIAVVAMAFNDWPAGGDAFNVVNDPAAWEVVLNSDVPLVVGSAVVTREGLALTRSEAAALISSHGPVGDYLYSLFADWLDRQAPLVEQIVAPDTWVIWDEVVVAYVLGMVQGEDVARPSLNADLSFSHDETDRRMVWITSIDTARVWSDFTQRLDDRGQ